MKTKMIFAITITGLLVFASCKKMDLLPENPSCDKHDKDSVITTTTTASANTTTSPTVVNSSLMAEEKFQIPTINE